MIILFDALKRVESQSPRVDLEAYATHFVWPGKVPFHVRAAKEALQ